MEKSDAQDVTAMRRCFTMLTNGALVRMLIVAVELINGEIIWLLLYESDRLIRQPRDKMGVKLKIKDLQRV